MNFGEKLQYLRKTKGLSQEQLAARAAVSRQAVSKWELGAAMPDTENILQISKLFGVTTDYLLNDGIEAAAEDDQNAPPMEEKETAETTGSVRRKKHMGRIVLIVLAIYMTAFAAAIITQPPHMPPFAYMPYFAMIATAGSIVAAIALSRDRR